MNPKPNSISQYHVFLASPGDVAVERQAVRKFFEDYNRSTAHIWKARFEVVDWENYSTIGVGRPQELINQQTLDKYSDSLALVIGIMGQRFGSPSGKAESGTEEEFNWAMDSHRSSGFPEIKWFFRKVDKLDGLPADPAEAIKALEQWQKVLAFRKRMQDLNNPVFYGEYPNATGFAEVLARDLNQWLVDTARPWAAQRAAQVAATGSATALSLPVEFDAEGYRLAVLKRYDKLNFEMLDTTGAFYNAVRLWSVFVAQSVRECHQYNPRLLEIPKEHQRRLLDAGEISEEELEDAEKHVDQQRHEYFQQPLRPVLEVVDEALLAASPGVARKLVILGDPGSGKSSLIRYLALRWAGITETAIRDTQPIPLVVELGVYGRWQCDGRKDFIRFLEEAHGWHSWPAGLLARMLDQPGRVVLLLDGLDEVFDVKPRADVMDDIQRFSSQFPNLPILVTSRVVGYQAHELRNAEFRHFMLQDLDAMQITDFLQRWHEVTFDDPELAAPKRDRLQKAIRESKSIAMLAGNPMLLTMMAILNRNQELPRDRADLYAQASRVLLHQWDTERAMEAFPGMSNEIGQREKTDILRRIAAHMQAAPGGLKGNLIDGPTLTSLIEGYLQDELHITQSRAVARAVVEHLRLRNFILCFVGADSYAFVHRTFLEYFCAADFVHQFNVAKRLDIEGLIALFDQHCREDEWREVLRLICGQIDEPFLGRIVEHLANHTELAKWDRKTPLPELPLAIWCLVEARNLGKIECTVSAVTLALTKMFTRMTSDVFRFVRETIVPACRELGDRLSGVRHVTRLALSDTGGFDPLVKVVWVQCILSIDRDRGALERFIESADWGLSTGAARTLLQLWPDEQSVALYRRIAVSHAESHVRSVALMTLAEKWPDQTTHDLLTQRAVQDEDAAPRSAALEALAEQWRDQTTHELLTHRAVQDKNSHVRIVALQALAEQWRDQATRKLLTQRAVQDEDAAPRSAALQALAEQWRDQTTHELLTHRAVQDKDSNVRSVALQALAKKWPDQTTRELLTQRAVQDKKAAPRSAALQALAKKWPDQTTHDLLTKRAVQDEDAAPRSAALEELAEQWRDQTIRKLLIHRAVQDEDSAPRRAALQALAGKWPDQSTRELLAQRAVQDEDSVTRRAALQALAGKWPDQSTRELLAQRAVQDEDSVSRRAALQALAEQWPDQTTRSLLAHNAVEAPSESDRGVTCSALGKMHSEFGRILPTRDLDGVGPYLDPLQPIPRQHIEEAAAKLGIRPEDIDSQVSSLSAHLGWDVTRGAKKSTAKRTMRSAS